VSAGGLRIGTRGSALALWQARHVAAALRAAHPDLPVEIVEIVTTGDRDRARPLSALGGKGVFVREIERALLAGAVDLAVHSLKDLPGELPAGLCLLGTVARAPVEDVLVLRPPLAGLAPGDLPAGTTVGTGSLRRAALLRRHAPQVEVRPIRGNVPTRLSKVEAGDVDGVILARAGLVRLGILPPHARILPASSFLPSPGQGLLGLEARADDARVHALVAAIADAEATCAHDLERAFVHRLGADCHVPVAALATVEGPRLRARANVLAPDAGAVAEATWSGPVGAAAEGGRILAERVLAAGGAAILASLAG